MKKIHHCGLRTVEDDPEITAAMRPLRQSDSGRSDEHEWKRAESRTELGLRVSGGGGTEASGTGNSRTTARESEWSR